MSQRVEAYAKGLFEIILEEGALGDVEDELFRFSRTLETSDDLRKALTDRVVPASKRQEIVEELLGGKAHRLTVAFVSFVVLAERAHELPKIVDHLVQMAASARAHEIAEVRSAVALSDEQRARLEAALSEATGKQIEVKVVIDQSVLGGLVARIGDTVIDGSVRHRLDQLKGRL